MTHDVFISYSSHDQKIVEGLLAYLEQNGVSCFVAYRDIPRGMVWATAITEAIDNCQMMIVIFSDNFNKSDQVDREIELCAEEKKPILTFKLTNHQFKGAKKYYLKNINWIDAFPNPKKSFGELLESIKKLINNSPTSTESTINVNSNGCKVLDDKMVVEDNRDEGRKAKTRQWIFITVGILLLVIYIYSQRSNFQRDIHVIENEIDSVNFFSQKENPLINDNSGKKKSNTKKHHTEYENYLNNIEKSLNIEFEGNNEVVNSRPSPLTSYTNLPLISTYKTFSYFIYKKLVNESRDNFIIGNIHFNDMQYDSAIIYYIKSINYQPSIEAYHNISLVYGIKDDKKNQEKYKNASLSLQVEVLKKEFEKIEGIEDSVAKHTLTPKFGL